MSLSDDKLYFKKVGSGENVLIMLHAFPANHTMFDGVAETMLPHNWEAIFPDFPGFGNTPEDQTRDMFLMEDLARLVHDIIPNRSHGQVVLGGVSMGGYVAMAFERQYPGQVDAYILSNTRDDADADGGEGREAVVSRIDDGDRNRWLREDFIPKALGTTSLDTRPKIIDDCWDMFHQTTDLAMIQTMRGMGKRTDSRNIFELLEVPILVITGEQDLITGPDVARDMVENYKNAELSILPETGHFAAMETPKPYAIRIKSFLTKLG